MTYKGMIAVNGVWISTPATLDFDTDDLDEEAFRVADMGKLFRTRIGKSITLTCTWQIVPDTQEFYQLFNILDNMKATGNLVTFPHPNGNNEYTMSCYRSAKLKTSMRSYYDEAQGKVSKWQNMTCSFIEDISTPY